MHATKLLHDLLDNTSKSVDKRLKKILFESVDSLIRCRQLTISGIGRSLNRKAKTMHNIKCIDRDRGSSLDSRQVDYVQSTCLLSRLDPISLADLVTRMVFVPY